MKNKSTAGCSNNVTKASLTVGLPHWHLGQLILCNEKNNRSLLVHISLAGSFKLPSALINGDR